MHLLLSISMFSALISQPQLAAWPGSAAVATTGESGAFSGNLSGLTYRASELWAVQNNPSKLYRLERRGDVWNAGAGRTIVYPDGTGVPDSEDLTFAEPSSEAMYIATERDNAAPGSSRLSVLRVDTGTPGETLAATHEWNLTASLPAVAPNLGLESITWIPDTYLVAGGLRVAESGRLYDPADYPHHGSGLFFTGLEASGLIYAFALNHADSTAQLIAVISSGQAGVMALELDEDRGALWAYCDDTCGNTATLLELRGEFTVVAAYARPNGMDNLNNEGIAIAPESECKDGERAFFWADDGSTGAHALRVGTIPCGPLY